MSGELAAGPVEPLLAASPPRLHTRKSPRSHRSKSLHSTPNRLIPSDSSQSIPLRPIGSSSLGSTSSSLCEHDPRHGGYISIGLDTLVAVISAAGAVAMLVCFTTTMAWHYREMVAENSECGVREPLPAVSTFTTISGEQRFVWRLVMVVVSVPRLLFGHVYYQLYTNRLAGEHARLVTANYYVYMVEVVAGIMDSMMQNTDSLSLHHRFTEILILSLGVYCVINTHLYGLLVATDIDPHPLEVKSLKAKRVLSGVLAACIIAAGVCWYMYRVHCTPHALSVFSLFEYVVILGEIGYHFTAYWDFHDQQMYLG